VVGFDRGSLARLGARSWRSGDSDVRPAGSAEQLPDIGLEAAPRTCTHNWQWGTVGREEAAEGRLFRVLFDRCGHKSHGAVTAAG